MKAQTVYGVTYVDGYGQNIVRYFQRLTTARRWAAHLRTTSWAHDVRTMAGGPGGMEVIDAAAQA